MSVHKGKHVIGLIPEPLMQILISDKMRGEEDWMHPDRARYEIEFRHIQKLMGAWHRSNPGPSVHNEGFDAVWDYKPDYPKHYKPPSRPSLPSSRRAKFIRDRQLSILRELISKNSSTPNLLSIARNLAEKEADSFNLKHRSW